MKDITIGSQIQPLIPPKVEKPAPTPEETKPFLTTLEDSLKKVNELQKEADTAIKDLSAGGPTSIHEVMLKLNKADVSLRLTMQIRNKVIEAYQEIMRMQV